MDSGLEEHLRYEIEIHKLSSDQRQVITWELWQQEDNKQSGSWKDSIYL